MVMNGLRVIDGALVRKLLDMESCIEAMRDAFRVVSAGEVNQPLRTALFGKGSGLLGLMPGAIASPPSLGIKVVSIFPDNFAKRRPTHQGVVVLFDCDDGRPLAVLDAHAITAIRTAAASAVATDLLARQDAGHLALLGYGDQATTHLAALSRVRDLRAVTVWGRDPARARAFAMQHAGSLPISVAATVEQAIADADIVCTLTGATDPILLGRWLRPGMHLNAVGSSLPAMAELDADAVARCRFFADCRAGAEQQAGEWRRAIAAGRVGPEHLLGEIGDVILGKVAGRLNEDDITCFKSLGMAAEDMLAAGLVLRRALSQGLGTEVPF